MKYGFFSREGSEYIINTPKTPDKWFNYLFNDTYYMEVSQTGQGKSMCLTPSAREYTRGYRYFYIHDRQDNSCWNPNYVPLKTDLDVFECVHSINRTEFRAEYKGIECSLRAFVPENGTYEIWTYKIRNRAQVRKDLSVYSVFSFENGATMGSKCEFHEESEILTSFTYPYHVYYEDKEKLEKQNSLVFMASDTKIASFDCSERRFFGGDDKTNFPEAVKNYGCSNLIAEAENPIGALEHRLTLLPDAEMTITVVMGCVDELEQVVAIREKILQAGAVEEEFIKNKDKWERICSKFTVNTPDENLNNFMNYWLKKQVVLVARNNRLSNYCPVRNQLQDAMGYSLMDNQGALELMLKAFKRQESNGFIQQWYMTDGSAPKALCHLKHKDAPIWLVTCMCALVSQLGDIDILDMEVEFKDNGENASIYEHMLRAIFFLASERGAHGLVLMGDGDWTDPINGVGRLGKGESTWSTAGLKYAVQQLVPFTQKRADTINVEKLMALSAELDAAINDTCWDGEWYVAGYDDFGKPFGSSKDEEARIFLNTQTWAIMSQSVREERLEKCRQAIRDLDTPCGPLLLSPAFSRWNAQWGRISIKLPGTTENGSIYCHASMFKAFADCVLGDADSAYDTIKKTLPTNPENPPEKSWQVPLFVPNYYFGLESSPNFGHSSQHHSTGTAAWLIWVVLDHMLGARATVDGVRMNPCIPGEWKELSLERTFKNARYTIRIHNPESVNQGVKSIYVNGSKIEGDRLPYAEGVECYTVEVNMGSI